MEIELSPRDKADRNEPSRDQPSTSNTVEPEMADNADLAVAIQPSDENREEDAQSNPSTRFTDGQRCVLDQWMADNHSTPYPTAADKEQLAQGTGLSTRQIQQYFCNYRRRHLGKSHLSQVASVSSMRDVLASSSQSGDIEMGPVSVDERREENSPISTDADAPGVSIEARPPSRQFNRSSQSPSLEQSNSPDAQSGATDSQGFSTASLSESDDNLLEWWLRVHCDYPTDPGQWKDTPEMPPPPSHCTGLIGVIPAAPGPSITTRHSITEVQPTTGSVRSGIDSLHRVGSSVYSIATFTSRGSRRGRRAYGNVHEPQPPSSNTKAAHECEQCGKPFKTGYTLKRHIQSVHESTERWVCAPVVRTEGSLLCPTCLQDPLCCSHGMLACWEKPEAERTFYRKDSLKQHLRLVHNFGSEPTAEDTDTLALLCMHRPLENSNAILQRLGVELVQAKSAYYEWAFREHGLSREMFESNWAEALKRAFALDSDAEPARESADDNVTEYCLTQLRGVMDSYDAGGHDVE